MNPLKGRPVSLRPLVEGDAEDLLDAVNSSRQALKRRLSWVSAISSTEDCRAFIRQSEAFAVIEAKDPGMLIGSASLQAAPILPGLAEASVWIRSDRSGRGYATQALLLLEARAFRQDALHKLYARIDPANRPGRKVLQKAGFGYEGCLRREKCLNGRWVDQECWGLLREEWKK